VAEIETVIGYQEAWRWWAADMPLSGELQLRSIAKDSVWKWDEENLARYIDTEDDPLGIDAAITSLLKFEHWLAGGFYAYKPESIEKVGARFFGRVALYGTVVECTRGFRAEKARVLDVWCSDEKLYNLVHQHPQVRGLFNLSAPKILDINGEERTDISWLTLENLNGSPASNRSSFRLKHSPLQPVTQFPTMPQLNPLPSLIWSPPSLYRPIKRVGTICHVCDKAILPDQILIYGENEPAHLECMVQFLQFLWNAVVPRLVDPTAIINMFPQVTYKQYVTDGTLESWRAACGKKG
jgi:hypothetical protein